MSCLTQTFMYINVHKPQPLIKIASEPPFSKITPKINGTITNMLYIETN